MKKVYVDNGFIIGIDGEHNFPFITIDDNYADNLLVRASKTKVNVEEFNKVVGTEISDVFILDKIFESFKTTAEILQEQVLELQSIVVDLNYKNLIGGV
jgi:hypothetical protein